MLKNKIILLGLTGGIAAYKGAELARLLIKEGAVVQAVMTENAKAFLTPLTLKSLTGRPVYSSLFEPSHGSATIHIDLAREPQAFVVAPATANFLGKLAVGLADDLLSTLFLAVDPLKRPAILAPAMNTAMFQNPVVQKNIDLLRRRGFVIADPLSGTLACGDVGKGRLVEPVELLRLIREKLATAVVQDFCGTSILITAGPTREALDPIRFISNHSSGRMGYALARAAQERGAQVILVTGPTVLEPPPGVELCPVESAREMHRVVMEKLPVAQIVIKTAAVADYRPVESQSQKIKKGGDFTLKLVRNPDILQEIGFKKENRFLVGFAAETENLRANAQEKMIKKNLDMIVANDLCREGAGFAVDTNIVQLLYKDGRAEEFPCMSKYDLSHLLLDRINKERCRPGPEG